jgi:hypothetical protein
VYGFSSSTLRSEETEDSDSVALPVGT